MVIASCTRFRRLMDWLPPRDNQPLLKYITFWIEDSDIITAKNRLLFYHASLLFFIAIISLIIFSFLRNAPDEIYWADPTSHTLLETFGSLIAIITGMILVWEYSASGKLNVLLLAHAFFVIGILDFFHAFSNHCYNLFVWYHSSGALLGSILFLSAAFTNYSNGIFSDHPKWLRRFLIIFGLSLIALYAVAFHISYAHTPEALSNGLPHHTPVAEVKGKFSPFTYGIGHLSATIFLITGFFFVRGFLRTNDLIYLIFATSMFLFFLSEFFFVFSELWDPFWWYWHCIKLIIFSGLLIGLTYGFTKTFHRLYTSRIQMADLLHKIESKNLEMEDAYATLKKTQGYLKQSENLASVGKMAAMMAHEIRNPLGAISNSVGVLKNYSLRQEESDEILSLIENEMERLNKLTDDFLSFAKPSQLRKTKINLHHLLDEILSLFSNDQSISPGIVFHRSFSHDVPSLLLDKDRIKQVFINIIMNSVQSIALNGTITIQTRYKEKDNEVEVKFADTGTGIPEDVISQTFQPFFTTRDKGLGLGLNIIYKIVKEHGGYILLSSKEGHGTEMKLSFPVYL
jgi:signal transduction histidine kinase